MHALTNARRHFSPTGQKQFNLSDSPFLGKKVTTAKKPAMLFDTPIHFEYADVLRKGGCQGCN